MKVVDRVLYKLDELVKSFVHKILVIVEQLLINKDYYTPVEGRKIIPNRLFISCWRSCSSILDEIDSSLLESLDRIRFSGGMIRIPIGGVK